MAIKTEVTPRQETEPSYPVLRQSVRSGLVVMFTAFGEGVVLALGDDDSWGLGEASSSWTDPNDESIWRPVKSVTLTMTED